MHLQINESKVTYRDEGEGEAILLIHGFCGSSEYWNNIIPELKNMFRVLAIDLPGHGGSAAQGNVNTIEQYATFIKDFLDSLNIEKVTMYGHSLGGYITLAFAEAYHERLSAFSLIHSTGFPDSEEAKKGRITSTQKIDSEGIEAFIEGLVPKLFSPDNLESQQENMKEVKKIGYETSSEGAKNALNAMKERKDRRDILDNTTLPVLLLAGDADQLIPNENTFSANGENITKVLLPGVGHMSMYEAPKSLVNAMKAF
ncbi:alpha/beta hydrolase [Psychrobacillus vulpis]